VGGAEVAQKGLQRGRGGNVGLGAVHDAVVVPGDREDRPVIGAERLVELVVVILAFAEVIDHVAEMEEEGRRTGAARLHVGDHHVRHRGLRGGAAVLGGAGVAHRMKRDSLRRLEGAHRGTAQHPGQTQTGRINRRRRQGLKLVLVQQVIGRLVIGEAGVVDLETGFVRSRMRFAEQAAGCAEKVGHRVLLVLGSGGRHHRHALRPRTGGRRRFRRCSRRMNVMRG